MLAALFGAISKRKLSLCAPYFAIPIQLGLRVLHQSNLLSFLRWRRIPIGLQPYKACKWWCTVPHAPM